MSFAVFGPMPDTLRNAASSSAATALRDLRRESAPRARPARSWGRRRSRRAAGRRPRVPRRRRSRTAMRSSSRTMRVVCSRASAPTRSDSACVGVTCTREADSADLDHDASCRQRRGPCRARTRSRRRPVRSHVRTPTAARTSRRRATPSAPAVSRRGPSAAAGTRDRAVRRIDASPSGAPARGRWRGRARPRRPPVLGTSSSPSTRATMVPTCVLSAEPYPRDRRLDLARRVQSDRETAGAASCSATPLACAVPMTVRRFCCAKTRSRPTAVGWNSSSTSSMPVRRSPAGAVRGAGPAGVRMHADVHERRRAVGARHPRCRRRSGSGRGRCPSTRHCHRRLLSLRPSSACTSGDTS